MEYFAKFFAWEPWNSDIIYKNGKLETRAVLEADRVSYNSLCKLLLGCADECGCRKSGGAYDNLCLLLNTDNVPGVAWCDAACTCHHLISEAL